MGTNLLEEIKRWTSTSLFLVRALGINISDMKKVGFINAYLDDKDHEPHYKKSLYLLFKPEDMSEFRYFHETEMDHNNLLVEDYDYDGGYVVLVYKFPEKYYRELDLFYEGQYSSFRKSYTDLFAETVEMKNKLGIPLKTYKSVHYHIFNRTDEWREMLENFIGQELEDEAEFWSIPDMEKETLNIEKVKEQTMLKQEDGN